MLLITTNLVTFETDINTSLQLSAHFKDDRVYVSESAISARKMADWCSLFPCDLVGTALDVQAEGCGQKNQGAEN